MQRRLAECRSIPRNRTQARQSPGKPRCRQSTPWPSQSPPLPHTARQASPPPPPVGGYMMGVGIAGVVAARSASVTIRGPVIVTEKIVPSSGRSRPAETNVDAGGAAHLAAFEGERSRVAKLRPAAANRHNVGIAGQPDSQEQRRVRSECRAGTAARPDHRTSRQCCRLSAATAGRNPKAINSALCDQPSRIATGKPGRRPSRTLTMSSCALMTFTNFGAGIGSRFSSSAQSAVTSRAAVAAPPASTFSSASTKALSARS